MKNIITLMMFFNIVLLKGQSNNSKLGLGDIRLTNVTDNSFTIERSDNFPTTIRLRYVDVISNTSQDFILQPNQGTTFKTPHVFTKTQIESARFQIYYDMECFNIDMGKILQEKQGRIDAARRKVFFKIILTESWSFLKNYILTNESIDPKWKKTFKLGLAMKEGFDIYKDVRNNGLTTTLKNRLSSYVQGQLKEKFMETLIPDPKVRKVVSIMEDLYNGLEEAENVDISDLIENSNFLLSMCSDRMVREYTLNYRRDFAPHIDKDGDGVFNRYDLCPDIYGKRRYEGCKTLRSYYDQKGFREKWALGAGITLNNNISYSDIYSAEKLYEFNQANYKFNTFSPYYFRITRYGITGGFFSLQYSTQNSVHGERVWIDSTSAQLKTEANMNLHNYDAQVGFKIPFTQNWTLDIEGGIRFVSYNLYDRRVIYTLGTTRNVFTSPDIKGNDVLLMYGVGTSIDFTSLKLTGKYVFVGNTEKNLKMNFVQVGLEKPIYLKKEEEEGWRSPKSWKMEVGVALNNNFRYADTTTKKEVIETIYKTDMNFKTLSPYYIRLSRHASTGFFSFYIPFQYSQQLKMATTSLRQLDKISSLETKSEFDVRNFDLQLGLEFLFFSRYLKLLPEGGLRYAAYKSYNRTATTISRNIRTTQQLPDIDTASLLFMYGVGLEINLNRFSIIGKYVSVGLDGDPIKTNFIQVGTSVTIF